MIFEQRKYLAAGYSRLSKDDDEQGESVSIGTQKLVYRQYCESNKIELVDEYSDDGYTGTNFDRPDFQRMVEDIKIGRINLVIVKDLSRFGRNMNECGNYIENFFDNYNVRLISIEENIDTLKRDSTTRFLMPLKNLFNAMYPQETSLKTIDALDAKAKNGEHTASRPPYGYAKSMDEKNKLVIDEEAAEVVRLIFRLAADGNGYGKIAKILSEKKLQTPVAYFIKKFPRYFKKEVPYSKDLWHLTSVKNILHNHVYLGKIVHGRVRTKAVSSKKMIKRPEDEWIIANGTHLAIITQELWEDAHKQLLSRKRTTSTGEVHMFAGLVACKDCGTALQYKRRDFGKGELNGEFVCGNYSRNGKQYCSTHYITFDALYKVVEKELTVLLDIVQLNEERIIRLLKREKNHLFTDKTNDIENIKNRLKKIDEIMAQAYEDKIDQILTAEAYCKLQNKYAVESADLQDRIQKLQKMCENNKKADIEFMKFVKSIRLLHDQKLNAQLLNQLIDKIYVGQGVKETGRKTTIEIQIQYKVNIINEMKQINLKEAI